MIPIKQVTSIVITGLENDNNKLTWQAHLISEAC
jgi:hypothetical protein